MSVQSWDRESILKSTLSYLLTNVREGGERKRPGGDGSSTIPPLPTSFFSPRQSIARYTAHSVCCEFQTYNKTHYYSYLGAHDMIEY